jgi:hypothetical protein
VRDVQACCVHDAQVIQRSGSPLANAHDEMTRDLPEPGAANAPAANSKRKGLMMLAAPASTRLADLEMAQHGDPAVVADLGSWLTTVADTAARPEEP